MEFQIPLSREDLLQPSGGSQFFVSEPLPAREIVSRLEECRSLLDSGVIASIPECFPVFFSLLRNFLGVSVSVREGYWRIGVRGLEGVCHQVGGANFTGMIQTKKAELRNTLKMMVYVVVQLVEEFETDATKPDSLDVVTNKRGGRKKKKNAVTGSESHSSGMDWGRERERVVEMTADLVENDLWLLWEPPSVQMMEDFSNLVLSLCYKLLENPGFMREKMARDKVFGLMGSLMKRFNMALGVGMKIPQLLQHFEHLTSPLAVAMSSWTQEYGVKTVVSEVVRELGRKDPRDLSQDTSGTRCFATFLVELSQLVPAAVLPSISVLMPHLSGESYTMRNGVLGVIGETVAGALSSPSLDEQSRITRDKLLDRLEQHLHDVNAFVRSRCLQIWLQLANAKAIPLPRLKAILPLVFGRTEDKSSNVRKNAVQLLTTVLAANPFAAKLNENEFKSRLVTEEAKLKALLQPESRNVDDVTSRVNREGEGGGGEGGEKEGAEKAGEVAKQAAVVKYLKDGVEFIELMSSCVPVCTKLLGSKVNTDILESLEFLATAFEFQVQGSREGVKKALGLVWSQEQQIKDSLVETYVRLFLNPQSENPKQAVPIIVQNLMSLTNEATYAELSSLEQMMVLLMMGKTISAPVVKLLWDIFTKSVRNVTQSQSCSAVLLLSMIAGADPEIANANIRILISHGLKQHGDNPDLVLARHCCVMLQKLDRSHSQTNKPPIPFRFPHSHSMFQEITNLLVSQFSSPSSSQWTPFAEQAIATIYRLSEQPDRLCGNILRSLVRTMSGVRGEGGEEGEGEENKEEREDEETEGGREGGVEKEQTERRKEGEIFELSKDFNSLTLSRLIFTAGHVAQWQVIHLETCVARELKRRREAAAERENKKAGERSGDKRGKTPSSSSARKTPRHTPGKTPGKKATGLSPSLEEEMGLIGATAEDVEGDMIRRVCEVDVGSTGLLSRFEPLIVSVVANPSQYRCPVLQTSAVLALSKYMMISHQLCEKYLQLLFTVLEKSADTAVRANTIVAAGDLAFRYPNLTEPWTPHLYARLQDPAPLVRKNTIIVLTHLILNDMIKVKGQISEMALVLEDKDESIAANARFFFSQLAKKGNDIYNVLPNIISHLSDPQRQLPREKFRNITRFLFSFVQKDKHCESLVEKICHRFRATRSEQQWRDLAHCLTQINFNDRCVRKLQENFTCYQDKLVDRDVYTSFNSVTSKAKKFAKPETKALITELEEMMKMAQQKGLEELEDGREGEGGGEESEKKQKKEENGRNASLSPPPEPLSRKKAKTTSKKASKQLRLQTPAKGRTKKVKSKVTTTRRLKAPPVALESDEEKENSEWNEDDDFRTDVLTSARQAVANSGSMTRRKPVRRVRGQKIRQLVFSSDEDEQSEREGDENSTKQRVPPRFTLSDDDI